jgi:hypothetical protein
LNTCKEIAAITVEGDNCTCEAANLAEELILVMQFDWAVYGYERRLTRTERNNINLCSPSDGRRQQYETRYQAQFAATKFHGPQAYLN